ncbi:DUF4397 domain-containing protein [Halolamina rubra]|uniref:DUF4397 domain-containing protein n=1 Tax=Halolamina rubra TaxID=1380430 RepID=UPI0006799E9C|nr:DUF4397 domain-containing protein [Halolamina rubra]
MSDQTDQAVESQTETTDRTRRRFFGVVGAVAGGVFLAGCGGPATETEGSPTGTTEPGTPMDTDTPTEAGTESPTDGEESPTEETDTGTETDGAMVRVAHLSPDAPNVDVLVDGEAVLEDVAFGAVSDYLSLAAGTYTVTVTPAGDSETTVFEGEVTVEAGVAYTVAAIGEVSEDADQPFEPLILEDDREPASGDNARVRAVHASPDAPAVDITAGGGETVLFDGVAYGESGSTEVPAGDYTLEIRGDTEGNDGEVVAEFDVTVEGGQAYSAFAGGYLSPDDEPADTAFDLFVVQDTEGSM